MYVYETEKANVTAEMLLDLVTRSTDLLRLSGVATADKLMRLTGAGNDWTQLAAVERAVELGYLREVEQAGQPAAQHRIFMSGEKMRIGR